MLDDGIWVSEIKYANDDEIPAYIEDAMLLNINAIESYAIVHRENKEEDNEEISED